MRRSLVLALVLLGGCVPSRPELPAAYVRQAFGLLAPELACLVEAPRARQHGPAGVRADGCLVFDAEQIDELGEAYGPSVPVGIFAHEVAHVLDVQAHRLPDELGADEAAGCALSRARLPLGPLLSYLADHDEGPPRIEDRTEAVMRGAERCGRGGVLVFRP
jgi:hypothetical protein